MLDFWVNSRYHYSCRFNWCKMMSVVVLLTLFCLCQGAPCPEKWIPLSTNTRCYYISPGFETFYEARDHCDSLKSQMATVSTCGQEIDLSGLLASRYGKCPGGNNCEEFWVGMHDIDGTNVWTTARGLKIDKNLQCSYTLQREFPKGPGRCVLMSFKNNKRRGTWINADCSKKLKFACITCSDGFEYVPEIDGCLYLNLKPNNWTSAQMACPKLKSTSQLLTIKDKLKQEAVGRFLQYKLTINQFVECENPYEGWTTGGQLAWTSGQTIDPINCDSPYVWKPVGATQIPFTYTNWQPEKPNCYTDDENCVVVATSPEYNNRWDDVICYAELCSICEF